MTRDPGTRLGSYVIERLLGRGGMGAVYLASDTNLGRSVALKLLAAELAGDARFRERFIEESRLASALDHPNIVPIYEAGIADGELFIAMRYVDGADLETTLESGGPMAPERAVGLLRGVADAIDAAHDRGLIHRDIKPGNVLIAAGSRGRDHAYLTDFGLTKRLGSGGLSFTQTGQVVGSVDFVAPEQIEGRPIDPRADVYSLAGVLYACLTGMAPFRRESDVATLWAHIQADPPRPSAVDPALAPFDRVIAAGMAKDPADRTASAGALMDDAAAALETSGPPAVASRRAGPAVSPARSRRSLLVVGAIGAIALGVVGFAVVPRLAPGGSALGPPASSSAAPSAASAVSGAPSVSASAAPSVSEPDPSVQVVELAVDPSDGTSVPARLEPGRYRLGAFRPPTSFTLTSPWWALAEGVDSVQLADYGTLEYGEGPPLGEFGLLRAQVVLDTPCYIDAVTRALGDQPTDFIDWVAQHPLLSAEQVRPVVVGGFPGLSMDIAIKRPKTAADCPEDENLASLARRIPLFPGSQHAFLLFNGDRGRVIAVDVGDGPPLLVTLRAPEADWERFLIEAEPVVASLAVDGV